ncbi:Cortactin-binding protein 2 (CortBP2), partial [Durusdinium trenchii]
AEKQKEAEAAPISGADNPTERAASGAVKEDDAAAKDRMGPKIIEFAQLGHVTDLQEVLVDHPSAVHTTNDDGRTLLHLAALNRHVETVRALLSARAAVRVADSKGEMPLHCAAFGGRIEVVEYLLAARAMVHDASESGQTALQLAQIKGSKEVIAVLKSRAEDADKDQREKEVLDEADASKTKGEFPYDKLAEDALFLISGTTSLDAGTLRRINQEKKKIGEPELSTGTNAQELLNELEEEGFSVFGCGVGEEDAPLYRRIEVNVGLLKYNASKPLISDTDLRLKRGLGKTVDRQDRWLIHYKHYSEKTKYGVLILAGTVDFFRLWAASEACRREVEDVPDGRLFAYIDGYILRVNSPKCAQLWASNAAGIGYIVWSIGDLYVGSLRASKQHGRGKYFFQNGDTFDGYFRGGQMHGNNGMYSYVNGDKLEGTWADGKAVLAQCKYHVQDGKLFEGHWPEEYMDARNVQEYVSSCS